MNSTRKFTKPEIYVLPTIALVLAIVALLVAVVTKLNNTKITNAISSPNTIIDSIATQNGFKGEIENHKLVISTTANGLLSGQSSAIAAAKNTDVTSTLLTGFNSASTGTAITANDTILSGLQKCAVLKQTELTGFLAPTARNLVDASDTLFTGMQKLQGNILYSPYIFTTLGLTTSAATLTTLWGPPVFGSTSFAANFFTGGTVMLVKTYGSLTIPVGANNSIEFQFSFGGTNYPQSATNLVPGPWKFTFESIISVNFNPSAPLCTCVCLHTLNMFNYPTDSTQNLSLGYTVTSIFDPTVATTMTFRGRLFTAIASTSLKVENAFGTYLFRP